jgi:DNA-3-methyladenine glycosylase II
LAGIIDQIGIIGFGGRDEGFHSLARSIISQQLSKRASNTIRNRLKTLMGNERIDPKSMAKLKPEELRAIGLSRMKTGFLISLAEDVLSGKINFKQLEEMDDETVISQLTQIKGVGRWTAEMYLMFSMNRLDVFPIDDVAIRNAMTMVYDIPKDDFDAQTQIIAERWKPYRTIACWYLYRYLDWSRDGSIQQV